MYDAGSRPDPGQQAASASATKAVHGVTGGHDIEFNAEGVGHLKTLLQQVQQKITDAGRNTDTASWDSSELDPVAGTYKPKSDEYLTNYFKWSRNHSDAIDKTINLLDKIVKQYKDRDDDEARAFKGE